MRVPPQRGRASRRAKRRRARRRRRHERGPRAIQALTSGALALPGLAGSASADTPFDQISSSYQYSYYKEDSLPGSKVAPGGSNQRMEVNAHQFRLASPIGDRFDVAVDVAYETMSGATPWYIIPDANGAPIQVMTGATVKDTRTDALLSGGYYLDHGRVGLTGGISVEDDYFAWNGSFSGERHFNEKNTTISSGAAFSIDTLEPTGGGTEGRPVKEDKQGYSIFAGISQVIGEASAINSSLSYKHSRGFLSDPYKRVLVTEDVGGVATPTPVPDSRPDSRHQLSWLTRYRHHFSAIDASVHADYRFYVDDWQLSSHTLELAWYQSLWHTLRLIPSFRYYTQSQAKFYGPYFDFDPTYASSDYRLSPFGAMSWRIKAETVFSTWSVNWLASIAYERYTSSGNLAIGKVSVENPGLVSFNLVSFGLTARF